VIRPAVDVAFDEKRQVGHGSAAAVWKTVPTLRYVDNTAAVRERAKTIPTNLGSGLDHR
jgi:hypothetical protein